MIWLRSTPSLEFLDIVLYYIGGASRQPHSEQEPAIVIKQFPHTDHTASEVDQRLAYLLSDCVTCFSSIYVFSYSFFISERIDNIHSRRDNENHDHFCDHDSRRPLGSILIKPYTQVFRRKISVEFVNNWQNHFNCFKMANILNF